MNKLEISEIQIVPLKPRNGLVAFASFILNNQFFCGNIAIYTSLYSDYGFRLVYPTIKLKSGKSIDIFHPINKKAGNSVQKKVVEQYLKIVENLEKGGTDGSKGYS